VGKLFRCLKVLGQSNQHKY